MENILCRFPHLFQQILEELDLKSLADCKHVGKHWLSFVNNEKSTWIRMIRELSEDQGRISHITGYISNCDPNNIRYHPHYGNTGCRVVMQGVQNWRYFCLRINITKGYY